MYGPAIACQGVLVKSVLVRIGHCASLVSRDRDGTETGESMSYDILKNLGLDRLDASSPDFLKTLERMQREAWLSLQREAAANDAGAYGSFES